MILPVRLAFRPQAVQHVARRTRALATVSTETPEKLWPQRQPLGDYYTQILNAPSPYPFEVKPEQPPASADRDAKPDASNPSSGSQAQTIKSIPTSSPPVPTPPPATAEEAARKIFGTRLYGDEEKARHSATKQAQSTYKAGVLIPPRPEEPDNCCMSGCVNCVWDLYREDMEEWSSKVKEADMRAAESGSSTPAAAGQQETSTAHSSTTSTDDPSKVAWEDKAFEGVPLGIREFMKLEKQLKERHAEDHTSGG